jgi:hypothetical protein
MVDTHDFTDVTVHEIQVVASCSVVGYQHFRGPYLHPEDGGSMDL